MQELEEKGSTPEEGVDLDVYLLALAWSEVTAEDVPLSLVQDIVDEYIRLKNK